MVLLAIILIILAIVTGVIGFFVKALLWVALVALIVGAVLWFMGRASASRSR